MRFFSELRAMVWGIMHSVAMLVWAIILLMIVMFIFACYITQTVSSELIDHSQGKSDIDPETIAEMKACFGNLFLTKYSLYKTITGGADWEVFADPLFKVSPVVGFFFCFYVAFSLLAILNVISGVFVANAMKATEHDSDCVIVEQTKDRKKMIEDVKAVFRKADEDGSGILSWEEFTKHLEDPCVQAYFRQLDIDIEGEGMHNLWTLLDFDGDGGIGVDEFVTGCQHLKGKASRLDFARLSHHQKVHSDTLLVISSEQKRMEGELSQKLFKLYSDVGLLTNLLNKANQPPAPLTQPQDKSSPPAQAKILF
eukprot:gnl/MRDRNA2_/MRDRNA2_16714_c0_seq2.p1 gnl/MRDRNA2_/MRDRNA2_16714_c0~~gnl/MRDRNA2_/MRDRNA2_16714_c0_seq2.p1  ORF type:complete len:311 (+),score=66.01 gnl/MRDRNA2_/MRDRNA2_16714_c0_seq2:226-1158(+)